MRWLLPLLLAVVLAGCGGGGGGSSQPNPPPPPMPRNEPLLYLYFGIVGRQIEETADHVNCVMTPDWGHWDDPADRERICLQTIAYMRQAKALGINKAIVCVGFLTFTAGYQYRGTAGLMVFRQRLDGLGLVDMVIATYPIDEPDVHNIADDIMSTAVREIRQAWPVKAAVIYGARGTPGLAAYDWIGKDDYGKGAGVLAQLPGLRRDQRWLLVPGGSDPMRNDPEPFRAFADAHNEVAAIVSFVWFDRTDEQGKQQAGIRSNGLAPRYKAIGVQL